MVVNYAFAAVGAAYVASFSYLYLRCSDRLPFKKYLSNHVLFLAPLNFLFTFFIRGRKAAVFDPAAVPGLDRIKAAFPVIRDEAKALLDSGALQRPPALDEPGYNTFEKGGWRMYPLKWYTDQCGPAAVRTCPQTCAVMDSIPAVRSAMFTVLPPGARLGRHHDPIASSLRYHLGLLTPNSAECALTLDGVDYVWRDGEELLFDQTYLHSAINRTDIVRVILFCDVEKANLRSPIKRFAEAVNYALVAKFTGANNGRKLSWISRAYVPIYRVRSFVKQEIRPRSMLAYNIIKFSALALIVGGIYLAFSLLARLF